MRRRRTTNAGEILKAHTVEPVKIEPVQLDAQTSAEETEFLSQEELASRYGEMILRTYLKPPNPKDLYFKNAIPRTINYTAMSKRSFTDFDIILNPDTEGESAEKTKYNYMYSSYPESQGKPLSEVFDGVAARVPSFELPGLAHAKIFIDNPSLIPHEMKRGQRFYLLGAICQDTVASVFYLYYDAARVFLRKEPLTSEWNGTDCILRFHK